MHDGAFDPTRKTLWVAAGWLALLGLVNFGIGVGWGTGGVPAGLFSAVLGEDLVCAAVFTGAAACIPWTRSRRTLVGLAACAQLLVLVSVAASCVVVAPAATEQPFRRFHDPAPARLTLVGFAMSLPSLAIISYRLIRGR